ncbi:isochorismatase hydrolase [Enterococcus canis]|uniref:Isochorismatase hydrolase n=1 Tax=Enterococcus canis TaxID=214095 RepID=A0A1L8RJJ0_9ENTE|nr:hydrolase [Enterococcus canis]OJG19927.1 isochorismatase hydrolase [Enterococcus canis]
MTSLAPRTAEDELLNPDNTVLVIIDYQPTQINSINSMNRHQLMENIQIVAKMAQAYKIPTILSTVNVATGRNQDTIPQLKAILGDIPTYDRTSINAWEDKEFQEAVKATGRKKILITALWTEACLTFPTLDALKEGYEVYPIVDAVGGTSVLAHETALRRVEQAGAQLTSIAQLACELQRDWNRGDTVPDFMKIMFEAGIFLKLS